MKLRSSPGRHATRLIRWFETNWNLLSTWHEAVTIRARWSGNKKNDTTPTIRIPLAWKRKSSWGFCIKKKCPSFIQKQLWCLWKSMILNDSGFIYFFNCLFIRWLEYLIVSILELWRHYHFFFWEYGIITWIIELASN